MRMQVDNHINVGYDIDGDLFAFNDTATTEIYTCCHTLSLHDALPISSDSWAIMALRSCIGPTTCNCVRPGCASSRSASERGSTPITSPPRASAPSATAPINPTAAPP